MTSKDIRGVVPILITPFDEAGRVDEVSLKRLIDFNIEAGVHGLGVALGSEVFKFNEAERDGVIRCVVKAVNGRVPVVINTGAGGTDLAVYYSKRAEELGADALMVIPPNIMPVGADEIAHYYSAISAAVSIPIFLQDVPPAPISPGLALRLATETDNIRYIKVETLPIVGKVADMVKAAGDKLVVFGGAGGGYFIEEMRRGSLGTMPFCSQPAAFVEVWNRFQAGDERGARKVFDATLAATQRIGSQGGDLFYHVHKQLLVRQGIIRTAVVRSPTLKVDATTQREIDELVSDLVPEAKAFEPA